jgi:hypothetical protein
MQATMRTRTWVATMAVATLAALSVAACGTSGGDDKADATTTTKAGSTTEQTTTTVDEGAPTTEGTTTTIDVDGGNEGTDTETSDLDTLPDGVHYGYMAGHETGMVEGQQVEVILFDKVDFLTGQAADDAAHEDGVIPPEQEHIENDYYIRNQNQTIRHLAVVPDASIFTLGPNGSPGQVPSSVNEVVTQQYLFKIDVGNVRGITTISSIEGVYIP